MGGASSASHFDAPPPAPAQPDLSFLEQGPPANSMSFDGPKSKSSMFTPPGASRPLVRSDSLNVINDPRIAQPSVITARMTYFSTISVSAALIASLAFGAMAVVQPATFSGADEEEVDFSYCISLL